MTRGYICVVQNSQQTDYLRLSYALALSLKKTQTKVTNLSIVTDIENLPHMYQSVFDHVIKIKKDRSKLDNWKLRNIVDLYDYTPYEHTVVLDSDMLFLNDVSVWWNYMEQHDALFASKVKNYLNCTIHGYNPYRQEFVKNNLPNVYNAFFYFGKNETSRQIFEMAAIISDNWDEFVNRYLQKHKPKVFSTDVAFALAIKILNLQDVVINRNLPFPYFTHLKSQIQGWDLSAYGISENWTQYTDVSFDKFNGSLGIKIGTVRQENILHYHHKSFLTDEMIDILEDDQ